MQGNKLPVLLCIIIIFTLLAGPVAGCKQQDSALPSVPSSQIEPEIPSHYTTYTSENGLFSISYPPEWEIFTSSIEDIEKIAEEICDNSSQEFLLEKAIEKTTMIFLAGLPTELGYDPIVNIVLEPVPIFFRNLSKMVDASEEYMKKFSPDYYMHCRTDTIVDGREATIIESESTISGFKTYDICLITLNGKICWYVTCGTTNLNVYEEYKDDFHHIVRSLRIYK